MALLQNVARAPGNSTVTLGSNVTTGAVLLVWQVSNTFAGAPGAFSKSSGDGDFDAPVEIASGAGGATYGGWSLYYAIVNTPGSLVLSVTNLAAKHVSEWSGLDTADLVEDYEASGITGTSLSNAALSTAASTTVVFLYGDYAGGYPSVTPDSGYTAFSDVSGNCAGGAYATGVGSGSPDPTTDLSASSAYSTITVALNEDAASPTRVGFII